MIIRNFVDKERYFDSVMLMRMAKQVSDLDGVQNVSAGMGTPLNKDTMQELGLLTDEGRAASVNDLILAIAADDEAALTLGQAAFFRLLLQNNAPKGQRSVRSLAALGRKDRNLAVISVNGRYAAAEAKQALEMGMNVFMFSDNVPLEEEIALKTMARDKGLLMMGPDCGLSFINGVAIGLCSKVRRGNIGIAAASGSGMQEVMNILHKNGAGVSHAIGVGGRDLHGEVGGITMLQSIDILENDPDTAVIALISKPPDKTVAGKIFQKVKRCRKPVVAQFINSDPALARAGGAHAAVTFEDTARIAMALAERKEYIPPSEAEYDQTLLVDARAQAVKFTGEQRYIRGLYCGGSLAEETLTLAEMRIGPLYGNIAFSPEYKLDDPFHSKGDCLIDVGAEEFTQGKPHVAIDPTPRISRFIQEARDPETAVILMDFLLGYALCEDPAGMMAPVIRNEIKRVNMEGRSLCVVASICGSDLDPQNLTVQDRILREAGVIVLENNGAAARFAALIIKSRREMLSGAGE